jgi:septal ring factor EnvC (AmiA/AmiB activator)
VCYALVVEPESLTVEILKQIRDEIRTTRVDLVGRIDQTNQRLDQTNQRLDQTNQRLDQTNQRLDQVETTLLDLAEQQRFVVRHLKALADRDSRLEREIDDLRSRVDAIESRLPPND